MDKSFKPLSPDEIEALFAKVDADRVSGALTLDIVTQHATGVLGSSEKANRWLHKRNRNLNGQTPAERLAQGGAEDVFNLLHRIAHGIIS